MVSNNFSFDNTNPRLSWTIQLADTNLFDEALNAQEEVIQNSQSDNNNQVVDSKPSYTSQDYLRVDNGYNKWEADVLPGGHYINGIDDAIQEVKDDIFKQMLAVRQMIAQSDKPERNPLAVSVWIVHAKEQSFEPKLPERIKNLNPVEKFVIHKAIETLQLENPMLEAMYAIKSGLLFGTHLACERIASLKAPRGSTSLEIRQKILAEKEAYLKELNDIRDNYSDKPGRNKKGFRITDLDQSLLVRLEEIIDFKTKQIKGLRRRATVSTNKLDVSNVN